MGFTYRSSNSEIYRQPKMYFGYILELEDGCYYVGITVNPWLRFTEHRLCINPSAWTRLHSYKKVHSMCCLGHDEKEAKVWERNTTLMSMRKYGWQNVRGGGWTRCVLKKCPAGVRSCTKLETPDSTHSTPDSTHSTEVETEGDELPHTSLS